MPGTMLKYVHSLRTGIQPPKAELVGGGDDLQRILMIVKKGTGHDFSLYKKSTINRRIERRMTVHQIDSKEKYAAYLKANPQEDPLAVQRTYNRGDELLQEP